MTRKRKGFLLAAAMTLGTCLWAEGVVWRPVTVQQLRQASDLIAVGKIIEVFPGEPGPDCVDRATLRIDRVLAGYPAGSTVTLVFPGHQRGRRLADGGVEVDRDPGLIRYALDQDGIFFLRREGDGTYTANHPARFKPSFFLSRVESELLGGPSGG